MGDNVRVYRKKPTEVRTCVWTGDNREELVRFVIGLPPKTEGGGLLNFFMRRERLQLEVWNHPEGQWVPVPIGNVVAIGVLGELYPIAPSVLAASFDPVLPPQNEELFRYPCLHVDGGPLDDNCGHEECADPDNWMK